jgi:hypothetical protein
MPAIKRVSNRPYKWKIEIAEAEGRGQQGEVHAAGLHQRGRIRHHGEVPAVPAPLIQGEDYPPYKNGLPQYVRLKNVGVKKKLGEFKL